MKKVTTEYCDEESPLAGAVASLERLLLVGPDSIYGNAGAHDARSAATRDLQTLLRAIALIQRRMQRRNRAQEGRPSVLVRRL
jgi:hypothetical protein